MALHAVHGAHADEKISLQVTDDDLDALLNDRRLLTYHGRTVQPPAGAKPILASSGYIHPFYAPNGAVVTNHYSPDHLHQRGIFFAWTKTQVTVDGEALHPDFWNIQDGTGRTRYKSVNLLPADAPRPGFRSEQVWELRHGDAWLHALDETWEVTLPVQPAADPDSPEAAHVIDIRVTHTPRYDITLPKYHYGGLGVRGSGQWAKGSDMTVLTSEGKDRVGADASEARWIDMSGTVGGKLAGIALLEHPRNMHAPNKLRMHPDMPYFVFAIPQAGPFTLPAGKTYTLRYRVVAHNGRVNAGRIQALWDELARLKL